MGIKSDTIVALSTGQGGAISVIRLSGDNAINIAGTMFRSVTTESLAEKRANSANFGEIIDADGVVIDQVVATIFRAPHSYTGEDVVEISCHASTYIVQRIIELALSYGAQMAEPGEFTQRAYLAGKLDLVQAEAVADIIASNSAASHRMAINQVKGGYSLEFKTLRDQLLHLVSLMELELDFGEEEVEFADRTTFKTLLTEINQKLKSLVSSFRQGNAMKNGVPTAIVGEPNAGKSTLLNALLGEERAIVSHIAGTTRDSIEECMSIGGVVFRFIDTAGIRQTDDYVESLGIERTFDKIKNADLIFAIIDPTSQNPLFALKEIIVEQSQRLVVIINKIDKSDIATIEYLEKLIKIDYDCNIFRISAKAGNGVDSIVEYLSKEYSKLLTEEQLVISNLRQMDLLKRAHESSTRALEQLSLNAPTDLIATDTRQTITHISTIIGDISTDDILGNIFRNFCIGK